MLKTAPRPLTVHDYRELPEGPPYYQLIDGELVMSPSPNFFHQTIIINFAVILRNYLAEHPIGKLAIAPSDVCLTDLDVYQPDLYFVSNERKSILSKQGAEAAPDLAVEILSPKTARLDKGVKREIYGRTGVRELWLVDPELREVQVFRLPESAERPLGTYRFGQEFESALFPGLKISLAKIFQE
jgi:Uma2 family endonuclease